MRIGMVLHGPEIVDTGSAKKIINIFKREHEIIAKLGGTMGRTAVIDAGLEDVIDISRGLTPSETINALEHEIDLAILLNHGKTLDTGRFFGGIVASRLNILRFVQIERPDSSGRVIYYHPESKRCAEFVTNVLSRNDERYNIPVEMGILEPPRIRIEGDCVIRRVAGAFSGENIRLNGIVIGKITDPDIEITCRNGKIVNLSGIKAKPHGIEKLEKRKIDLITARIKTGAIRRTIAVPRIKAVDETRTAGKIAIIDHAAESTFELVKDADLVITIGDDTTAIASDILVRLGIPVIGIIDGDADSVLQNGSVPKGSVIIKVKPGFDDVIGKKVSDDLFRDKQQALHDIEYMKAKILAISKKYTVERTIY